jgi:hypothetical protein
VPFPVLLFTLCCCPAVGVSRVLVSLPKVTSASGICSAPGGVLATVTVLKLIEEKQEQRSEILQSWEDVTHKVVKALSELI